ncbi:MAG: undecaprenyl-diphosphate phosphatase [Gammaproteobacteria bacterium]
MDILHLIILGLIQGLTEFLPISSSAHLILVPLFLGEHDQGLAYDVAAHVGSLGAVVIYFRRDLGRISTAWIVSRFSMSDPDGRVVWFLIAATVPVAAAGLLLHDLVDTWLRDPLVIAAATIGFGLLLLWSDRAGKRLRSQAGIGWRDAILIGLAQVLALIPGTSRAGITMTAGLFLGLQREAAARFSFLLAIPVIALAGAYESWKLASSTVAVDWPAVMMVTLVSGITAALTIHYFLRFLEFTGMLPYVIYRLVLGAVLLVLFL